MKRRVQVCWDATEEHETETDWYATGYLCNYFLSLAEDELQPDFGDGERKSRIQELEEVRGFDSCPARSSDPPSTGAGKTESSGAPGVLVGARSSQPSARTTVCCLLLNFVSTSMSYVTRARARSRESTLRRRELVSSG